MGVSTNAIIAFAVLCEEESKLPWDEIDDVDEWWCKETGYVPKHHPWTPEGNYAEGWVVGDPRLKEYHQQSNDWLAANPRPFELITHCSYDFPMYALAVPDTVITARRGFPITLTDAQWEIPDESEAKFYAFIHHYGPQFELMSYRPQWHLMSMWG